MVPFMADHPIPKLAEAGGDSTPSGQNIEENETTCLGSCAFRLAPFEDEPAEILVAYNPERWIGTKDEVSDHCRKNRKVSTHSGWKIVRQSLTI